MAQYEIHNSVSGVCLGIYGGATADDALDAMARVAGYSSFAQSCAVLDADEDAAHAEMDVRLIAQPIAPAGYIVVNNEAVHGLGATAADAWDDFLRNMKEAGIVVLGDEEEKPGDDGELAGSYTLASDYKIVSATAALMAEIEANGGAVAWWIVGGVACTTAEYEGE